MLSKQEKKRLAREAMRKKKEVMQSSYVISTVDHDVHTWKQLINDDLKHFGIHLEIAASDNQLTVSVADMPTASCTLTLLQVEASFYEQYSDFDVFEELLEAYNPLPAAVIMLSGQRELSDAINFIFNTLTRVLGRLTRGMLIDVEQEYVGSDYLAWSCDYDDENLFKAFNYPDLAKRYPQLLAKR